MIEENYKPDEYKVIETTPVDTFHSLDLAGDKVGIEIINNGATHRVFTVKTEEYKRFITNEFNRLGLDSVPS